MEYKRRTRPTVAQQREMEEVIHRQCIELDAWREKYRCLKQEWDDIHQELREKCKSLEVALNRQGEEYTKLAGEADTLKKSSKYMEEQLNRVKSQREDLERKLADSQRQVFRLQNRGFLSRLFNRE